MTIKYDYSPCGVCDYTGDCDGCKVEVLEKLLNTVAQQSLSGSADATPKSLNGVIVNKSRATIPDPPLKPYINDPRDF